MPAEVDDEDPVGSNTAQAPGPEVTIEEGSDDEDPHKDGSMATMSG